MMKLPEAQRAVIAPAKIRNYLLSTSHPVGRFKAPFFSRLGYTVADWQRLEQDLLALAGSGGRTLDDIRDFLKTCQYISDREQFGKDDYWMPPEEFERRCCGDCDDFALWTWRQLMAIGKKDARFVVGVAGRYIEGHAWVTFVDDGKHFLLEATSSSLKKLPRLETTRYVPGISLSWDGTELHYFEHEHRRYNPRAREGLPLFCEWSLFWVMTRPVYVRNRARRLLASRRRRAAQQFA